MENLMLVFSLYGLAVTGIVEGSPARAAVDQRLGQICVLWPSDARDAAERQSKAVNLSWVFPDNKPTTGMAKDVELLEVPSLVGPQPRIVDFKADPKGANVLIASTSGSYLLTLVPRNDRANEFDAIFGKFDGPGAEYNGGCHTILANAQMIADLRKRGNGYLTP